MDKAEATALARRFIALPAAKRRVFWNSLQEDGIDFGLFPIPDGVATGELRQPSYAQRSLWLLWQLDPLTSAYHIACSQRLTGPLDADALEQAFVDLAQRHETLRTTFEEADGALVQRVHAQAVASFERHDLGGLPCEKAERRILALTEAATQAPFDLAAGPLLRASLFRLGADEHVLLLVMHHIVSDAWSLRVMVDEVGQLYEARRRGTEPRLPALPIQYADHALWQRAWLEAGEGERQLAWWTARLGHADTVLSLPTDRPRPAEQSFRGAQSALMLPAELTRHLNALAQARRATPFMLLLAAFKVLLYRWSGQGDLRVGVPVAGRARPETERLIGLFVNTQVLRTEVDGRAGFTALLEQVREAALGAQAHQDLPFEQIVDALRPERSLGHNPLFQVMFNHTEAAGPGQARRIAGLTVEDIAQPPATTQFDLTLGTALEGGRLACTFTYATDLFEPATIERLGRWWVTLLGGIVAAPERAVDELPLLDEAERRQLVTGWNSTDTGYDTSTGLLARLRRQAEETPEAVALVAGDERLSYRLLHERADRLAGWLVAQGVGPDTLVGIAAERSTAMVVGLLGVLKAGAAYVPLDPELPPERLAYMVRQSGMRLLLAQAQLVPGLPELAVPAHPLEQNWSEARGGPPLELHPLSLAYCIFTSGSTGRPKGVGNSHAGLLNRLLWMQAQYGLGPADRVLQKTPFGFDVSVWEFLWPLLTGATLVMAPPGAHRDPAALRRLIVAEGVTTLHFVPSMLQAFIAAGELEACTSLRRVICSGEALPLELQRRFLARHGAGLHNLYGPTEAAIDVTAWDCREEAGGTTVPIGRPIANTQVHLLDRNLESVPVGVLGELHLGGVNLARGYAGRPDLTAERFVPDPFGTGGRLYRTGDLGRRRADGAIEYAGRIDQQLKLRGLRIEPGEIEARLLEHGAVREAAVVAHGGQLVAYIVGEAEPEALQRHLRASLPDYMVPAQYVVLDRLPLSANGKLDRNALPAPARQGPTHEPPASEPERLLCQAWQDLLGLKRVGATDNFFALGGDSILAIQLVSRAREHGLHLTPRHVFQHQTVREMAKAAGEVVAVAERQPASGEAALLPIQHWFFEQPFEDRSHWNQAVLLRWHQPVDRPALARAIGRLLDEHDALRLRFERDAEGKWRQTYLPRQVLPGPHLHESSAADAQALAAIVAVAHRSLDIATGRVLHAELVAMADGSQRLLLVIHHLVVDGVSWRILLGDLNEAYRGSPRLPARTSSTQEWAAALTARADAGAADRWEAHLARGATALPADMPWAPSLNGDAERLTLRLDRARTALLLKEPAQAYRVRVDELLLAALAQALCRWGGGEAVLVQLEGHGREEQLAPGLDLSRTVGWLTSLFPVRLEVPGDAAPGALIKAVKEQLRAVPDAGMSYGISRYLASTSVRERMEALPAAGITFNYMGQLDGGFAGDTAFELAPESSGEGLAPDSPMITPLVLEGQVQDGELSLVWSYSRTRYRRETISRLAEDFRATLEGLIAHCASPAAGGVTPSDFPLAGLTQAQLDSLPFPARRIEDVFPLAPMQEGLLMHTLLEPDSGIYLMQEHYLVDSRLDPPTFLQAWREVLARNAALRATFHWNTGGPLVQAILRDPEIELAYLDWLDEPPAACEAWLAAILEAELREGFDLDLSPPFRLRLIRLAADRFCFVLSYHHILMDAWSRSQLMDDLLAVHRDLLAGSPPRPRPAATYRDFVAWLQNRDEAATRTFWQRTLEGFDEPTRLPMIRPAPRPVDGPVIGDAMRFLDEGRSRALRELALERQLTVNSFVQAAWALMLHLYGGRDDVLFGVTVAGRPADVPAMQATVGLFISSIPLRVRLPNPATGQSVADWLTGLQARNLAMREHEHLPLTAIAECSELPRGTPLFDSLFVFESEPVSFAVSLGAEQLAARADQMRTHTNYPLTVVVYPGDRLGLHFSYDRRFFADAAMPPLLERFGRVLEALVEGIDAPLRDLPLLDPAERTALVEAGNATRRDYPLAEGYARLFEQAAARHHGRVVAACAGQTLTYEALNRRANRVGHALIAAGVRPDDIVALLDERGLDLLAMILGTFKAGAGYLALDPAQPLARLREVLAASGARVALCGDQFVPVLDGLPGRPHLLAMGDLALRELPEHDPGVTVGPHHLAYAIYTSGSTGRPKGVLVEQAGMLNNQLSKIPYLSLTSNDVIAQTASQGFDISVWQMLAGALCGARVEIVPDAIAHDPPALLRHVARTRVTVLEIVPAVIQGMLHGLPLELPHLRWLLATGEALPPAVARQWCERYPQVPLVNAYGPAECSDDVALHRIEPPPPDEAHLPIGTATDNNRLYILDRDLRPLPAGAMGELYVGGVGVGRGYLGAPSLTASTFLPNPFARFPGERVYRTGDLARLRPDGLIEYQGRADRQVKIRGFRIEPGEIEARLLEHPAVREAAVTVHETPLGPQLAGHVAALPDDLLPERLRQHLKACLPDYMVPAQLMVLEHLPHLPSGKLDRRALPAPAWDERRLVPPRTPTEHRLAAIWGQLLRLEQVGVTDGFYELGGHSLLLTQLVSRLRGTFAVEVPLARFFEDLTVRGMAAVIDAEAGFEGELDLMADLLDELEQVA